MSRLSFMNRLAIFLAALFVASGLHAQSVIDPQKQRNTDHGHAVWKTARTSNVDTPYVIPVNADGTALAVATSSAVGATHYANGQVATSTTAATFVIARPTRTTCMLLNMDATITVYVGRATVTSGNGVPLKAGQSMVVTGVELVQVIAASGTPTVAYWDEFQ